MALKIISADERMKEKTSVKLAVIGPHKIGKTSLLRTLPQDETLLINLEAGELAIKNSQVEEIRPETWQECVDIACIFGGPDISKRPDQPYSQAHYDYLIATYPEIVAKRDKYHIHFWDSISVASRLCWQWAGGEPESFSEKTGAKDTRGTYGLIGREIVAWLTHIQHTREKIVVVVGGLDSQDDFANPWKPQIEGSQSANKMPGIFDEIICMVDIKTDGDPFRAFVCHKINPWKYPAGDRSGCLELIEPPHLGALIKKIEAGKIILDPANYNYTLPEKENSYGN